MEAAEGEGDEDLLILSESAGKAAHWAVVLMTVLSTAIPNIKHPVEDPVQLCELMTALVEQLDNLAGALYPPFLLVDATSAFNTLYVSVEAILAIANVRKLAHLPGQWGRAAIGQLVANKTPAGPEWMG